MLGELLTTSSPSFVKRPHRRAHHTCTPAPAGHLPDRGLEMAPLLRNDRVLRAPDECASCPQRVTMSARGAGQGRPQGPVWDLPKPSLLCCSSQMAIRGGDAGNGGSQNPSSTTISSPTKPQWGGARPRKQNHALASNPPGQRGWATRTHNRDECLNNCHVQVLGWATHTQTHHTHTPPPLPLSLV